MREAGSQIQISYCHINLEFHQSSSKYSAQYIFASTLFPYSEACRNILFPGQHLQQQRFWDTIILEYT